MLASGKGRNSFQHSQLQNWRAKSGRRGRKQMERHQWSCTSKCAVQDPSGPSQFDSIFIRVPAHQGYSAFDRSDHVFSSKEASGMMFWMTLKTQQPQHYCWCERNCLMLWTVTCPISFYTLWAQFAFWIVMFVCMVSCLYEGALHSFSTMN